MNSGVINSGAMSNVNLRAQRALQVSMSVFVWLATLMLGMGEENYVIPIVSLIACVSAFYLTDLRGWLRLNNWQANLAGLATVVVCFWELRQVEAEIQVLTLANLLFYLQCVNLFRHKEPRIYWMLALLSVLEVAVAAVLNDTMLFGFLLALYFLVGLATLALFLMLREHAEQRSAFGGAAAAGTAGVDEAISWPMARQLLNVALATLALMGALFVITPRTGDESWGQIMEGPRATVGYQGNQIKLGDEDSVSENTAEVLRARLFHHDSHVEFILTEPLLLRGAVLSVYEGTAGKASWSADKQLNEQRTIPTADEKLLAGQIEQEFVIRPLDDDTLFSVYPFHKVSSTDELRYDLRRERLYRRFRSKSSEFRYNLVSPALQGGRQSRLVPAKGPIKLDLGQLEPGQQQALPGLIQMAADVVRDLPPDDHQARAEALEKHLRDSGRYVYSLQPPPHNSQSDPLENFVTATKAGHCEYFASALVLMLRSQGIPARIVMGFKTTEYNKLGHFYQVRQLHAHAWAEAYVPQLGGWWRLDPTPSSEEAEEAVESARGFPTWREIGDFVKHLWSGYVVGLTAAKQREEIYKPILAALKGIFSPRAWRQFFSDAWTILGGSARPTAQTQEEEPSTVGILLLVVALLVSCVYRLSKRLWRWRWPSRQQVAVRTAARRHKEFIAPVIGFYRRFEQLLARHKLVRPGGQTQREFARDVGGHLADRMESQPASAVPRLVVDAFYRVRFGGLALDKSELEGVEKALHSLENALPPMGKGK